MKKLKKMKLNAINEQSLKEKEMSGLKGGTCCYCSCYWEGKGGSSSNNNSEANWKSETISVNGCNSYQYCTGDGVEYVPSASL